jgi:hypothetical protein
VQSVGALDTTHIDMRRTNVRSKARVPRPVGARTAAEEIDAERAVLGEGVYREVRLGEWNETGDSRWMGKHVPDGVRDQR